MRTSAIRAAAIIPAYKQPGLLAEAVASALDQSEPCRIVIVDDGCPLPETREVATSFARAYPNRVYLLRRANGGPSAARNAGVDFACANWPELEALMFLDADNRIARDFLTRALAALDAAPAAVGWVYPDIDMIGIGEHISTGGAFSALALYDWNYCEMGSVVRRALFEAQVRFDESLREGFEDWDFWLQAVEAGFRGQHLPNAGFEYRRRGESRLAHAERRRDVSIDEMNAKRRPALRPRALFAREAGDAPRFALIDTQGVEFVSDPALRAAPLSLGQAAARLAASQAAPGAVHFPTFLCFGSRAALAALESALLLPGLFWLAQTRLRHAAKLRCFLTPAGGVEVRLREQAGPGERPDAEAALILAPSYAFASGAEAPSTADLDIELPADVLASPPDDAAAVAAAAFRAALRAAPPASPLDWRRDPRPPRNDLLGLYARLADAGAPLPVTKPPGSRGEIGFVIPIHAFSGVEKVVVNHARVLRGLGFRPHLFVTSRDGFLLTPELKQAFVSVTPLLHPGFDATATGLEYFGVPVGGFARDGAAEARRDLLGVLAAMDIVVDTHALGAHTLAGRLKQWGVRLFSALHVVDREAFGAPFGHPHVVLAYEHAYDGLIVISEDMRRWCLAHGVPAEKLVLAPNAPGYAARGEPAQVGRRREARAPGPLRALFLGRLDKQKGLDNLARIIAATRGAMFSWRIVGKAVLDPAHADAFDPGLAIEPAVYDPESLDALYDWADVFVVPSRFEGAPLTILEARRRGAVVIAADVGAVREVIGAGGYLVEAGRGPERLVEDFVRRLKNLARDEETLRKRVRLTLDDPPPSWEETLGALVERVAGAMPATAADAAHFEGQARQ